MTSDNPPRITKEQREQLDAVRAEHAARWHEPKSLAETCQEYLDGPPQAVAGLGNKGHDEALSGGARRVLNRDLPCPICGGIEGCDHTVSERERAIVSLKTNHVRLQCARQIADEQANDRGLWCSPVSISAEYLQQELRRLHAAIEGEGPRAKAEGLLSVYTEKWALGVGRDVGHPKMLTVGFVRELSDDEMRSFHDYIRGWRP